MFTNICIPKYQLLNKRPKKETNLSHHDVIYQNNKCFILQRKNYYNGIKTITA